MQHSQDSQASQAPSTAPGDVPLSHRIQRRVPCLTALGMAGISSVFTNFVYNRTYRPDTLRFGIISTTGFTIAAALYMFETQGMNKTAALIGASTSAMLGGMTSAAAFRSRQPAPMVMAVLSLGSFIVNLKVLQALGLDEKAKHDALLAASKASTPTSTLPTTNTEEDLHE